jgi:4-amino-4-deoxy-L-arabinose transferase-like glycosyltransferase
MRPTAFLLLVAIAAFALLVGFTVAFRGSLETAPLREVCGADPVEYDLLAQNVVAGKGYAWDDGTRTSFRAPGFPFFLALLYAIVGVSYPAAYLSFAVWGAVGVVAAYLLTRELTHEQPARVAALVASVYPPNIYDCSCFFSEVVFAPCLGLGLWLLARHIRTGSKIDAVGCGLLLGYATLTRPFGLLFLPIFFLCICDVRPRGWRPALLYAASFMAVIVPWSVRNYLVHGQPVLIATNGGSTFYGANNDLVASNPKDYGNWVSTTRLPWRNLIDSQPNEVSHDKMEWKLGIEWTMKNPEKFAGLGVAKVVRFWLPFVSYPSFKRYPAVNILSTTPFLILILVGMARTIIRWDGRRAFAILHLAMIANLVMVVIFWGEPRFRDANAPVLVAYVVAGLWWIRWRTDIFSPGAGDPPASPTLG